MKKTFKELRDVDSLVAGMYFRNDKLKETKFGYAFKRFAEKNFRPLFQERGDEVELVRVENALEDPETKEILLDKENPRGYKYSKEGLKKCLKAESKIIDDYDKKEVEIKPHISSFIPEDLTEEEKEMLKGLLI